ncbi:MAG: glucuronate isomerase [Chitinispirillaceae bacterium]|nr:glucuronate isomerase [Chitinispirillaceae bacterium]
MGSSLLNPYRVFDAEPTVRKIAIELYESVKSLPLICPHGHVDPKILAENTPFTDPTELIIIPDHYLFRMLYSQGIPLEKLGIPSLDGTPIETDHRKIWQLFADNFYLFAGTPTGLWLEYEFYEVFGIKEKFTSENAMKIYDEISEKILSSEFRPRALFERFNIEVLTTTDHPSDDLKYHKQIKESGWKGKVIPCFRPDPLFQIASSNWVREIQKLEEVVGNDIVSYKKFIDVIQKRREFFKTMGAVSTDQGVEVPYTHELTLEEADKIFQKALKQKATIEDEKIFIAHMLMEMGRMSIEDGLVMQLHAGCFRNHNREVFRRFGPDKGSDIPVQTEFTRNLYEILNKYGNDFRFTLIVFTLDENCYSVELAPLAGHYPAMKIGPAWWFYDSIEGMTRYRERITSIAGFYNTVGFNDDTRAFASIPARHDLCRRVDANFLARLVSRHIIDMSDAFRIMKDLIYNLPKKAYRL